MTSLKLGLLGFGIVGSGVVKVLQKNASEITTRANTKIKLAAIADLDLKSDRGVKIPCEILTKDGMAVCRDPSIDIIVETVGGTGIAAKFIETALKNGKHVITANKALLAQHGEKLFKLAAENNKLLLFEAAVGGAIPIIRTLKTSFASERLEKIYGILNGTCNFILTKLTLGGREFADVLKEAQKLGYAEADPTLDISGGDTAHKIALIAMLAFGTRVPYEKIFVQGITQLAAADFEFAKRLGRKIKLVAIAKREKNALEIRVHPTLLPKNSALVKIDDAVNAVAFYGKNLGECLLSGLGAGSLPTATAVVGDIIEAARALVAKNSGVPSCGIDLAELKTLPIKKIEDVVSEFYLRFLVRDEPGVVSQISRVLAKFKLNIRDILQLDLKEFKKEVPLAMILHSAKEKQVRSAVAAINRLKYVKGDSIMLRAEE
jgi:homoserine dehydrogenase